MLTGAASGLLVNGEPVPQSLIAAHATARKLDLTDPGQVQQAKSEVAKLLTYAQYAKQKGFDVAGNNAAVLELARLNGLAEIMLKDAAEQPEVSDEQAKAMYDQQLQTAGNLRYRMAYLVVADAAMAAEVEALLAAGKSFEDILLAFKDRPNSKALADSGWITLNNVPPELVEPLRTQAAGTTTNKPVQLKQGLQFFKVLQTENFSPPPFEQLKAAIIQQIQRDRANAKMAEIEKAAKLEGVQ
jgi:peptidyl-prolyl cis-trans isomerase C